MKACTKCGLVKPIDEYHKSKTKKDGTQSWCKECARANTRRWNTKNPHKKRDWRLKNTYGISLEDYNKMYELQGGVCAICGLEQAVEYSENLSVDHDHETGAVRELLCHHCNVGLGGFKDDPRLLNKASAYLMKHLQPLTSDGIS